MDPIEIEAPDGSIVEFPAGTDDATIQAAMAEAYPADPDSLTPPEPASDETGQDQRGLNVDADGNIGYERTWEGVNELQAAEIQRMMQEGTYMGGAAPGTNDNPFVIPEDFSDTEMKQLIERGVTFIDREGRQQRKSDPEYGLYVGMARPAINTMNWLESGVRAVNEGAGEAFSDFRDENMRYTTQEGYDELEAESRRVGVRPGRAEQVVGSMAATAPLALATRNPWLLGAAEGALTSNAQDAGGLARDTAFGAVVGKGGDMAVRGLGSIVSPNINPATRRLVEEGTEVSPGQLMGGVAHQMEDAMTGIPALGEIPNAAQRRALETMNQTAIQRPMTALGVELPRNLRSTHEAIDFAQQAATDAYEDLIPRLQVRLDQDFATEFRTLNAGVQNMNAAQVDQWTKLINNEVMPRFNAAMGPANGRITGESFKELESILSREVRDFTAPNASPHDRRYASAVRELQSQLRDMLARNNPAHAERLQSINDAYRQLTVLEDAAQAAPAGSRGQFTPHILEQAARRADPSVRRRATARGDALFQDLSQDAGEVMRRTVNDSGTATRGAVSAGLGAALLGTTLNVSINPWAVGALALGAIPYNRTGNRLFTAAMMRRPDWAAGAREFLDSNARLGGMFAAGNNQMNRNENRMDMGEHNQMIDDRSRMQGLQEQVDALGQGEPVL